MKLSTDAEQFEKAALRNDSLVMNQHIYLEIDNDLIDKSVSVKNAHAIKTGILYKDGTFESRRCFKGFTAGYYEVNVNEERPSDKDTLLLLQELGWTNPKNLKSMVG